jgi:hypothetical protein
MTPKTVLALVLFALVLLRARRAEGGARRR